MLSNPFPGAFGLDIADLSVKVVQLRHPKGLQKSKGNLLEASAVRSTQLPPGLIVNGELQQPEKLRHYLRHIIDESSGGLPITSPWVVASLPEPRGFTKLVEIPKAAIDIIEEDVVYAATQHIPVALDELYLSWQIMSEDEVTGTTQVLIGSISKKIADMYTYLLESLGLGVVALESEAIATVRAMHARQPTIPDEAVAIVDLGAVRSSVIVCDRGVLQFTFSLPYSGEILTTALAEQLGITHEEAEQKKREYGLAFKEQQQLWHILMNEATEKLAVHIKQAIDFYYYHSRQPNRVKKIIFCGGASQLKHLDQVIASKLNIEVSVGNPWYNIVPAKNILDARKLTMEYETCVGLALRAIDNPFVEGDEI